MRVLLVEDDATIAKAIELTLQSEGVQVYLTDLGEEGVDLAKIYEYDLILQDIHLPDMNGIDAVRKIRTAGVTTPIMMISGSPTIENKTAAFAAGADDFLAKPFHKDELLARAHAIIRRSKGYDKPVVTVGQMAVDLSAKTVSVGERQVRLTGKEYQMFELLVLRKGTTVNKEMFLDHLYAGLDEPELKIIDVFICKLRTKLRAAGAGGHIQTVWGRGYRLQDTPGTDEQQKAGTLNSLVGKVLARLADEPGKTISRLSLTEALKSDKNKISVALKDLRDRGLADRQGGGPNVRWSVTPAGVVDARKRQALAATP